MKKRALGRKKKYLFILGLVIVLLAIGAAGYWYYQQRQQQVVTEQKETQQAADKLDEVAFRGDRDVAAEFTQKIDANDPSGAGKVYRDKIAATDDINEKISLYNQYIGLAYQYELYDQALDAALAVDELQSTYLTLAAVASAYGVTGNNEKQIEYFTKALEAVNQLPPSENTDNMKQLYQSMIDEAKKEA